MSQHDNGFRCHRALNGAGFRENITNLKTESFKLFGVRSKNFSDRRGGKIMKSEECTELKISEEKKIITYVLDTNVIMNSWDSLFKFEEHNVCIVSQVWIELDKHKIGKGDINFHARKAIRVIDSLIAGKTQEEIVSGVTLVPPDDVQNGREHTGKLMFDFSRPKIPEGLDVELSPNSPDDQIIMAALSIKARGERVILVSNDASCRVKALLTGLEAEGCLSESVKQVAEEDSTTGFHVMPEDFWETIGDSFSSEKRGHVDIYCFNNQMFRDVYCNEFLVLPNQVYLRVVEKPSPHKIVTETFSLKKYNKIFQPRNIEQVFAFELLMDPKVVAVSLAGLAGSGKTYLALAAAFCLLTEENLYRRVIVTRSPEEADKHIGFLPGDEEDKMNPWLGGLYDNLESFIKSKDEGPKKGLTLHYLSKVMNLQIKSMGFMKGRSLEDTLLIIEETQDIPRSTLKTMLTRIGKGSKVILLGNVAQIDNAFLTENTCGLSVFIRSFVDSDLVGHITLQQGERSPFATLAEKRL